jgi:hypothetical protein
VKRGRAVAVLCVLLGFSTGSGCLYRRDISYSVRKIQPAPKSAFTSCDLEVALFEDARAPDPASSAWYKFIYPRVPKNDEDFFYNSDRYYKKGEVPKKISKMIAKHLKAVKLFRTVTFAEKGPSPRTWLLTGKIRRFEGLKEPTISPEMASQFGLIGAIITSMTKTEYQGYVVLSDVRLLRPDRTVAWEGEAVAETSGENMADPSGWDAYVRADEALKVAVASLVKKLSALPPSAATSPSRSGPRAQRPAP